MKSYNEVLEASIKKYTFKCITCGYEYQEYIRVGAERCPSCKARATIKGEHITIK